MHTDSNTVVKSNGPIFGETESVDSIKGIALNQSES